MGELFTIWQTPACCEMSSVGFTDAKKRSYCVSIFFYLQVKTENWISKNSSLVFQGTTVQSFKKKKKKP